MKLTFIISFFLCNGLSSSQVNYNYKRIIANKESYLDQATIREPDDSFYSRRLSKPQRQLKKILTNWFIGKQTSAQLRKRLIEAVKLWLIRSQEIVNASNHYRELR